MMYKSGLETSVQMLAGHLTAGAAVTALWPSELMTAEVPLISPLEAGACPQLSRSLLPGGEHPLRNCLVVVAGTRRRKDASIDSRMRRSTIKRRRRLSAVSQPGCRGGGTVGVEKSPKSISRHS